MFMQQGKAGIFEYEVGGIMRRKFSGFVLFICLLIVIRKMLTQTP
jgi:hypothetical protein